MCLLMCCVCQWLSPVDRAYWWLVLPVFLLGLSLTMTQLLGETRETCNDWVVENVNLLYDPLTRLREASVDGGLGLDMMCLLSLWVCVCVCSDMADRAEVIERFGYSYLLHSATRMGRHARFLARLKMRRKLQKDAKSRQELLTPTPSLGPDELWEEEDDERGGQDAVEAFFHKALKQDPQHAQNLAWYIYHTHKGPFTPFFLSVSARQRAAVLMWRGSCVCYRYGDYKWLVKGELEEARALYERAVRAQPRNRHLLESLAHFLNANPGLRYYTHTPLDAGTRKHWVYTKHCHCPCLCLCFVCMCRFAGPQSLACYQKAVQQHRGHSKYSKFYVNSSDPGKAYTNRQF